MAQVGLLSVVQPRLPGHTVFRNKIKNELGQNALIERTPVPEGYYHSADIKKHAEDLTGMDLCAIVAADSRSAIALMDARATTGKHRPIIISVPNNPALELRIGKATDVHVMGSGVSEPEALAYFTSDLLLQAKLFPDPDNLMALIYNDDNPGSQGEVNKTKAWFDTNFATKARRVKVASYPVKAHPPAPGTNPADAAGLYDINSVLATIRADRAKPNVKMKAIITTGDPTIKYYRDAIKNEINMWNLPTVWDAWSDLYDGGLLCWAANRQVVWQQVADKALGFCGGDDPELESIPHALVGNIQAAEGLSINWKNIPSLCKLNILWLPDVPPSPPEDLPYTNDDPKEPPTDLPEQP